VLWRIYHSHV